MKKFSNSLFTLLLLIAYSSIQINAANPTPTPTVQKITCLNRRSPCFLKTITCPIQCPSLKPTDPNAKACFINCDSPICKAGCKHRKPSCNGNGAACYDPRFIGGDGVVFYFHGRKNEHFSLVSDHDFQINAKFMGLRPAGRPRDYTWIQALGIQFGSHNFSVEATKAAIWDSEVDHLKFSYNENEVVLPQVPLSVWRSGSIKAERISSKNVVIVSIPSVLEVAVSVVPVTKEDDKVHKYQIPSDDCFAHLEVQFRFFGLSPDVEGVLGRTYRPDFENPAKLGVALPVLDGEDDYKISSLFSADCKKCVFSSTDESAKERPLAMEYGELDCTSGLSNGIGIVCKK